MAMAIDGHIATYLSMLPYPKSSLLDMITNQAQFTSEELSNFVNFSNYQVISLEELEADGIIVSGNDPTQSRITGNKQPYDKKATKVKINFKLDENNLIEDIYYLVNLAGPAYEKNAPYSNAEPFFYLVSFNDDFGTGTYGDYDLTDNDITLISGDSQSLESVLEVAGRSAHHEQVILLPEE